MNQSEFKRLAELAGYRWPDDDFNRLQEAVNDLHHRNSYGGPDPDPVGTARLEGKVEVLEDAIKGRNYMTHPKLWRPNVNENQAFKAVDGLGEVEFNLNRVNPKYSHWNCIIRNEGIVIGQYVDTFRCVAICRAVLKAHDKQMEDA